MKTNIISILLVLFCICIYKYTNAIDRVFRGDYFQLLTTYNGESGEWVSYENNKLKVRAVFSEDSVIHLLYDSTGIVIFKDIFYKSYFLVKEQYFVSGRISIEKFKNFRNGEIVGPEKHFDEFGNLMMIKFWKNNATESIDSLIQIFENIHYSYYPFFNKNILTSLVEAKLNDGNVVLVERESILFEKYENGKIKIISSYVDEDLTKSVQIVFYDNGFEKEITNFRNGKIEGEYFEFTRSGGILINGFFNNDLKNGSWKYYSEKGKLMKEEIWNKGELVVVKKISPFRYKH